MPTSLRNPTARTASSTGLDAATFQADHAPIESSRVRGAQRLSNDYGAPVWL